MAKEALPYPDLPETPAKDATVTRAMFWRAAWLRNLAEYEALKRLAAAQYRRMRPDVVTQMALADAIGNKDLRVRKSLQTLVGAGGLLFAWAPDAKGGAR